MRRTLAPATAMLIAVLLKPASFWKRFTKRKIQTLDLIAQSADSAAIPYLLPLLLDNSHKVAQSAATALATLMQAITPSEYPWLDGLVREHSPYRWSLPSVWAELEPSGLERLQNLGTDSVIAVGMATFHRSGYVREEAVRALPRTSDGREVPFLLLRLNDWVPAVRAAALKGVREHLGGRYAPLFVSNIALVVRLRLASRGEQDEIIREIEGLLKTEDGRTAVMAGLGSADPTVRRACYEVALETRDLDHVSLIERALAENDAAVRRRAVEKIPSLAGVEAMERLLLLANHHRFGRTRRQALQVLAERLPDKARPLLEKALLEVDPAFRGYAQFQLAKAGVNVRAFYVAALAKSGQASLAAAISGIGETGTSTDGALVMSYLSDRIAKLRRAVLRALARLQAAAWVEVFEQYLADESPSVSREAMKGLAKTIHLTTGKRIWRIFTVAKQFHIRRNALYLVARMSKWESISYLLEGVNSGADGIRELTNRYISRWSSRFNSSFTEPTPEQAERLTAALQKCGPDLGSGVRSLIEYGLRSR